MHIKLTKCRAVLVALPFAAWLLLFNITTVLTIAVLYLANIIIPGTIGSRPDAVYLLLLIEIVATLIVVTSAYAFLRILFDAFPLIKVKVKSELKDLRAGLIRLYLIINLIKHPRELSKYRINESICMIPISLEPQSLFKQ